MAPITPDTLYTKTAKGLHEISNKTVRLSRELGLVFFSIDGKANVGELLPRSGMSAPQLHHALNTLVTDGYIKVVSHPGQHATGGAARVGDVDFTPPQALTSVNIEAASRALAAADAAKRAQTEARAALDARMRQESEARGRAQAETRVQAEALARASAEEAERAAANERARAEIEARDASDPLARADAEMRARAAAAAAVRAHAEARVRAEAEERARTLVETKRAAEEEARREAEARTHAEQQAQARAAAEGHAREVLEAQVQAMRGVRALADDPQAGEAEAARARVRELEADAGRAREAARGLAEAEGLADEVPQPEMDITERVRQLNARVQTSRGWREAAERQARDAVVVDFQGKRTASDPHGSRSSLQPGDQTPSAQPPQEPGPSIEIPLNTAAAPTEPAPSVAGTTQPDLPVIDLDRAEFDRKQETHDGPGHHAPSALERAMALMTARKHSESKRAPEPVQAAAPLPVTEGPPEPRVEAEHAEKIEPTLDDEPLHEKLNIDRAAHDIIAEGAEARRKAETQQLSRAVMDARRKRMADDARRTAADEARHRRKKALWIAGAALVIVPTAAVVWLQSATLNGYIPDAQRALSLRLNQPVTISKLRYVLLPTPRLVLEGVTVGDGPGISVERVDAHVRPFAALAGPRHFDTVDVHGAAIDAAMLGTIPAWTGGRTADSVHVDRLRLTAAQLNMPGRDLGAFDGNVAFESNGTLKEAVFTGPNARLELTPRAEGVRFAFDASNARIPFGLPAEFSQITINGLVDPGQIAAAEFTGTVAGGSVEGALTARWAGPVSVQGEFKLQNARVQDLVGWLAPNFSAKGSLRATGRFGMQGAGWSALRANPQVEANFSVARGELTNIDVVRAIQAPSIGAIRGGRTPFDELSGVLQVAGGHYLYRRLQLASGALNANGTIDVAPNGQLNGRLYAELSSRGGVVGRSALAISGTVQNPQLKR